MHVGHVHYTCISAASCPIQISTCHTPRAPKDVLLQESLVEIGKVELNDGVLEQISWIDAASC